MNGSYSTGETVLGKWQLGRLIGEGSFGKVYEATRNDFGSYKAAIKIITIPQSRSEIMDAKAEGMDDASVTRYFRSVVEEIVREFELMSKFKGTANIVSYEDHDVIPHDDGFGWDILIRMELLTPMMNYVQSHPMTTQDVIRLGIDICKALELCQRYNVIHRDIKPENIFVSETGDFKLGDFGIARTVEKTTGGLSKKGTYTYMAPEVYREEAYGPSVDIYSLGVVLYRLLNDNRAPFLPPYPANISHADREAALSRRISGEPLPAPRNADPQLAQVVLRACAFNPNQRYWSPSQMRSDLEALLGGVTAGAAFVPGGWQQESTAGAGQSNTYSGYTAAPTDRTAAAYGAPGTYAPPVQEPTDRTSGVFNQPHNTYVPAQPQEEHTTGVFGAPMPQQPAQPQYQQPPQPQYQASQQPRYQAPPQPQYQQPPVQPQAPQQPPVTQAPPVTQQTAPEKKKSGKGLIIGLIAAVAVLAIVLCVVLFGGGGKDNPTMTTDENGNTVEVNNDKDDATGDGLSVDDLPDSGDLFPAMLWGTYSAEGIYANVTEDDHSFDLTQFAADIKYEMVDVGAEYDYEYSVLPFEFRAYTPRHDFDMLGDEVIDYSDPNDMEILKEYVVQEYGTDYWVNFNKYLDLNLIELKVCDRDGDYTYADYAYRLEGNKLILCTLNMLDETTMAFELVDAFEAKMAVEGNKIILSRKGSKITFVPEAFNGKWDPTYIYASGYVFDDAQAYKDIVYISISGDYAYDAEDARTSVYFTDGHYPIDPTHTFNEDGTITIKWDKRYGEYNGKRQEIEEPFELTCEYLISDGLLLKIDGKWYRYQNTYDNYYGNKFQGIDTENMSEEEVQEIVATQTDILADLNTAFNDAGISASIDQTTGKVSMDASILFASGDYTLSDAGKAYLDGFLDVYTAVVLSDAYAGCVSEIVIEGHTDTDGTYDYNMTLSENRAGAVADYCIAKNGNLESIISTKGYSYDNPVYNEDGSVDMAASRRVTFRFVLTTAG